MNQNDAIVGTTADLINGENPITLNGQTLTQSDLSVLNRLGIVQAVGVADRPQGQRGPAPKIWSIPTNGSFAVARK